MNNYSYIILIWLYKLSPNPNFLYNQIVFIISEQQKAYARESTENTLQSNLILYYYTIFISIYRGYFTFWKPSPEREKGISDVFMS